MRISAARAVRGFCGHLRSRASNYRALMGPVLPATADGLVAMATAFSGSSEIVGLVLENLASVLLVSLASVTVQMCF